MSFSGGSYPAQFADEIQALTARGVIAVAAAGNPGSADTIEAPGYPAALANVIAVGSHDGQGLPSYFSQNGPEIAVLADGEDVPGPGCRGTSFAAPQVAATVANVQAIVPGLTGHSLGVAQMIDVLREGGAGPRSLPDPPTAPPLLPARSPGLARLCLGPLWRVADRRTRICRLLRRPDPGLWHERPCRPAAFRALWQCRGARDHLRRHRLHRLLRRPRARLRHQRPRRGRPLHRRRRTKAAPPASTACSTSPPIATSFTTFGA